jgi:hypothetical protein
LIRWHLRVGHRDFEFTAIIKTIPFKFCTNLTLDLRFLGNLWGANCNADEQRLAASIELDKSESFLTLGIRHLIVFDFKNGRLSRL